MATATDTPAGIAEMSRAVVSAAAEFVVTLERAVVGEDKIRTARGNAWAAIQADRARARARDEMDALVRALLASDPRTGSSGRALSPAASTAASGRASSAATGTAASAHALSAATAPAAAPGSRVAAGAR